MAAGFHVGEEVSRLSYGNVGSLSLKKEAAADPDRVAIGLKNSLEFVNNNPELLGSAIGAIFGGIMGGMGKRTPQEIAQDPNAPLRNRLGSIAGGAASGALVGHLVRGSLSTPFGFYNGIQMMATTGTSGTEAGRETANLFGPQTAVPRTVSEILGKKQQYSDKALFEKYWDEFGSELDKKGPKAPLSDKPREEKFVAALRDLYTEAGNAPSLPPKTKGRFFAEAAGRLAVTPITIVVKERINNRFREASGMPSVPLTAKGLTLQSLPAAVGTLARTAKGYRQRYIDPGVTVENKADAVDRSKFDDEQLRSLLRGLKVEEVKVKQHVIK